MPSELFQLFCMSGHPEFVSSEFTFPRPSEWQFEIGEEVYIMRKSRFHWHSLKLAVISAFQTHLV